jgi:hypothetical protein
MSGIYFGTVLKFEFCTFWSATIHRRFGIFRLGANYSLSNVSCGDAEKVLRTGEQSGDKSPQSKKNAKLELSYRTRETQRDSYSSSSAIVTFTMTSPMTILLTTS